MILVDANLLIYAVNQSAADHRPAREWLDETLSGDAEIGLAWVVLLAFLRITTHPSIFEKPLSVGDALDFVDSWLAQPFVSVSVPGPRHWFVFKNLIEASGSAGNLTTDAHLAALAIENGARIYSADNDFKRFAGVNHVNPLA